jgi:flagellar motor switch protein FliM
MASEQLSQSDIDALLGGGAKVAPHPEPVAVRAPAELYDFRRPRHVSKERLRTLEAMYERLVKSLEAWLIGRVRKQVELRLQSVEQFSFGEFTLSLPTPCAAFGFDILNIEGQKGLIDIGHEFAYLLVDRFFGGGGQPASMHRALTPIERLAVRTVVERISVLLAETWQDYVELQLDITSFESVPDMVQGIGRSDPVLVANIEVVIGSETSMLLLCLPLAVLDKFFSSAEQQRVKQMTGSESERQATRRLTETALRATNAEVAARLPAFPMQLRNLLNLPVGSILTTGLSMDTPLELHIGGHQRFHVSAGKIGNAMAVRLID